MSTDVASIRGGAAQTWLSVRFELLKHLKRRRLAILVALATVLPLLTLIRTPDTALEFAGNSLGFMMVLIIVSAAMFAGDAVCGEFEKKTSLLLFPTPQNRASIFAGKYLAALLCTFLVVSLWYLVLVLEIGPLYSLEIPADMWKSFVISLLFSAAAVGVAFLVSSVLKRSISATILIFLILMMVMPVMTMIMTQLDTEPWFIVTYSANLITSVMGASSGLPAGPHGGTAQQFTPTIGTGIAVMATCAVVSLAVGMAAAVRKED